MHRTGKRAECGYLRRDRRGKVLLTCSLLHRGLQAEHQMKVRGLQRDAGRPYRAPTEEPDQVHEEGQVLLENPVAVHRRLRNQPVSGRNGQHPPSGQDVGGLRHIDDVQLPVRP